MPVIIPDDTFSSALPFFKSEIKNILIYFFFLEYILCRETFIIFDLSSSMSHNVSFMLTTMLLLSSSPSVL